MIEALDDEPLLLSVVWACRDNPTITPNRKNLAKNALEHFS
jgi:hypothetical protein